MPDEIVLGPEDEAALKMAWEKVKMEFRPGGTPRKPLPKVASLRPRPAARGGKR